MAVHTDDLRGILAHLENMTCYLGEVIDDDADMDLHDLWNWVNTVMSDLHEVIHSASS